MRKVIEVLRLRFDQGLSHQAIARALGIAQGSVQAYLARFVASGVGWPLPAALDEAALEARLFRRPPIPAPTTRALPEWSTVHAELKRKGVTLQLLWQEYKARWPEGYQYTQFCRRYHAWTETIDPVLRNCGADGKADSLCGRAATSVHSLRRSARRFTR